ncbi:unnamed protein product [Eruca vesicaria subsp. sativa]|uniref:Cytochrome P450 n=1 Tax=Eruca vesicaria subsp. sativa TaxID=29727 RepID=A0ABC8LXQ6_ERUVS|nr:unnamed protein product [Eruca vesicaria subsp. sativa]
MVVVSSSEAAEEVLKTHDLECCTRPFTIASMVFSRNGNDSGFVEYGEAWRELRKLAVREFFSVTKVRSFRYIREEESDLMVKQVRESALKQSPVDLSKTLFCLTASIVFRTAFGQSFLENKHIDKERIEELMLEAHSNMTFNFTNMFPTAGLGWFIDFVLGQHKRLHDVFTELKNFTLDRPDLVDYLLEVGIYLAGVDTSSITMIWTMAELVRNPRVMEKMVNAWSIGRDPKHWKDPEEFIPERFIDCSVDYKEHSFEMLPFGSGRRMCPGMASGMATVELGLLNLLYYFNLIGECLRNGHGHGGSWCSYCC